MPGRQPAAMAGPVLASKENRMIALFLLLVILAVALGLVGVVVKGLLFLLFIGIVVFLAALLFGALRMRRRPRQHVAR